MKMEHCERKKVGRVSCENGAPWEKKVGSISCKNGALKKKWEGVPVKLEHCGKKWEVFPVKIEHCQERVLTV